MHRAQHPLVGLVEALRHERDVAAGLKCRDRRFRRGVVVGDGAHGKRVGDDDARVPERIAQHALNDGRAERGRRAVADDVRQTHVSHHDHGHPRFDGRAEGHEVHRFQLLVGRLDGDSALVGITGRRANAREVLGTAEHLLVAEALHLGPHHVGGHGGVARERTQAHGVTAQGIHHIGHGSEIQVESKGHQVVGDLLGGALGRLGVAGAAEGRGVAHILSPEGLIVGDAHDGAALFIDSNEGCHVSGVGVELLDVREHGRRLLGVEQVLSEVDDAAHGMGRYSLASHVAGLSDLRHAFHQRFRRHDKQLGHLLLERHGADALVHSSTRGDCGGFGVLTVTSAFAARTVHPGRSARPVRSVARAAAQR